MVKDKTMENLGTLVNKAVTDYSKLVEDFGEEHIMTTDKMMFLQYSENLELVVNNQHRVTQNDLQLLAIQSVEITNLVAKYYTDPVEIEAPEEFKSFSFTIRDAEGDTVNSFFSELHIELEPDHYSKMGIETIKDWFDTVCQRMPQRGDTLVEIVFDPSLEERVRMKEEADY